MTNLRSVSLKARIFISFFGILLLMLFTYIFIGGRFITRFTEKRQRSDTGHAASLLFSFLAV